LSSLVNQSADSASLPHSSRFSTADLAAVTQGMLENLVSLYFIVILSCESSPRG
jgi:hypothetical protein